MNQQKSQRANLLVGISKPVMSDGTLQNEITKPTVPQRRPWFRYLARRVDYQIITFLAIAIPYPSTFPAGLYPLMVSMILLLIWVFVEAALLASWGTTPGKWLLGITVRTAEGEKLTYRAALQRSLAVWSLGLACGFTPITYLTLCNAAADLTSFGVTSWDQKGGYVVTHEHRSRIYIVLAIGFLVGSILLVLL
jgi:uncharacterized RDD family membrane protein YckC